MGYQLARLVSRKPTNGEGATSQVVTPDLSPFNALLAPRPVHRAAFQVHDSQHSYFSGPDGVQYGVRKPPGKSTAYAFYDRRSFRMMNDGLNTPVNLIEKTRSKPGPFCLVIASRLIQFSLGILMEADSRDHLILDRAWAKTSPAGRLAPGSASICESLRWASAAQSLVFSSSESSSRLTRSRSASLARDAGSSLRAWASMSSTLMVSFYPCDGSRSPSR